MDKKYNSTTNPKYLNNHIILNLKSTSQRISMNNFSKPPNIKNSVNYQSSKNKGENSFRNNLIDKNHHDNASNINKNIINDDISLDNISNIISNKQNKLPNTQMIFEEKESSIFNNMTNPIQNRGKYNLKNYNSFSITNTSAKTFCNKNTMDICDSHTKSFQLKLKKMKEMNRTLINENYIMKSNTFNFSNKSSINGNSMSKSIINCKQKIINMKNKNILLNKNYYLNEIGKSNINGSNNINFTNSVNGSNDKKTKQNETIPFLCCFSKS